MLVCTRNELATRLYTDSETPATWRYFRTLNPLLYRMGLGKRTRKNCERWCSIGKWWRWSVIESRRDKTTWATLETTRDFIGLPFIVNGARRGKLVRVELNEIDRSHAYSYYLHLEFFLASRWKFDASDHGHTQVCIIFEGLIRATIRTQ